MEAWLNTPFTLRLKVFLILLMGIGSLLAAAIVFFVSHDRLLLVLSGIIFGCCLFRSTDGKTGKNKTGRVLLLLLPESLPPFPRQRVSGCLPVHGPVPGL